jgi:L-aspartate oxidase
MGKTGKRTVGDTEVDVLVVGAGLAGLVTAYYLAEAGLTVAVLSKNHGVADCNSNYAQGGIIYRGQDDSPSLLGRDIRVAGSRLNNPAAVKTLADEVEDAVRELLLEQAAVAFDRDADGIHLTAEAAHSVRRIIHAKDATGRAVIAGVNEMIRRHKRVKVYYDMVAIDVISKHHSRRKTAVYEPDRALGVYAYSVKKKQVVSFMAAFTVLASGGFGAVYLHSTNHEWATGDGMTMAARSGVTLINLEYTQFHPTTFYTPGLKRSLISEALRGEGAVLVNMDGEAFMKRYHKLGSLAPRDIATRAILREMQQRDEDYVFLDTSRMNRKKLPQQFPTIFNMCKEHGIDIRRDPIPVVPAYHFSCGGIKTDLDGQTSLTALYAVGEAACNGLHGANRLASTSLAECVVFGRRTGRAIAAAMRERPKLARFFRETRPWNEEGLTQALDPLLIHSDLENLRNLMWHYVGPVRSRRRLERAWDHLQNLRFEIESFYKRTKLSKEIISLRNAIQVARYTCFAAMRNKRSHGCHYRID